MENYNFKDRVVVDKDLICADSTAIILTLGQSNSASYGEGTYRCQQEVYEYYYGRLFLAAEPLLGATGNGGCSVWTRVADLLVAGGHCKRVILISLGVGGTSIDSWSDGIQNKKILEALSFIEGDKIKVTHIIWHQGETDNIENTDKNLYKSKLGNIFSQINSQLPESVFYVCIASFYPNRGGLDNFGISPDIQQAQYEFIQETAGVKQGANTDLIISKEDRYDGVHFSKIGLEKFARSMYLKLVAN